MFMCFSTVEGCYRKAALKLVNVLTQYLWKTKYFTPYWKVKLWKLVSIKIMALVLLLSLYLNINC